MGRKNRMTTNVANNGNGIVATLEVKQEEQPSQETLLAAQRALEQADPRDGSGVTDDNPETGPDEDDTDYARSPEGQRSGRSWPEEQVKDTRHHGPYATEEEAKANPVKYGSKSKKAGETLALHCVALANYPTQYWYGMNYHHAAIQALKAWGGTVAMCGSGRGSAMVAANNRATEAEMRAAQALQAKLDAENAQFTQLVLLVKACGPVALTTIQDVELRQRVESAIAQG